MKECRIDGCGGVVQARGLCPTHYGRIVRRGSTDGARRRAEKAGVVVSFRLPADALEMVDAKARREGISRSGAINSALSEWVASPGRRR